MARPIKETPVLRGKDAEIFAKRTANPAPVSDAEKDAARKAYEAFKAISTFPMKLWTLVNSPSGRLMPIPR